jgi:hypothetical protein
MQESVIFVGWASPTMLERLIIAMVGNAHPTLLRVVQDLSYPTRRARDRAGARGDRPRHSPINPSSEARTVRRDEVALFGSASIGD